MLVRLDELLRAWRAARRGKRGRPDVARFEVCAERELLRLARELEDRSYRPRPFEVFTVHDPRERTVAALAFRDRVVQHLLLEDVGPRIAEHLAPQTWACIPGRGSHAALRAAVGFARHRRHVLRLDVRKFFPSVHHDTLRGLWARVLPRAQERSWWLSEVFLTHDGPFERSRFHFPGDDLFGALQPHGLPIGNLTSQWWANLYLSPVDHMLARQLGFATFARYMDDLLVFDDDRGRLEAAWAAVAARCDRLRLRLHPVKCGIVDTAQGFRFVGFDLTRVGNAVRVRLADETVARFEARAARLVGLFETGAVSWDEVKATLAAWRGHASHAHTRTLCARVAERYVFSRRSGE